MNHKDCLTECHKRNIDFVESMYCPEIKGECRNNCVCLKTSRPVYNHESTAEYMDAEIRKAAINLNPTREDRQYDPSDPECTNIKIRKI